MNPRILGLIFSLLIIGGAVVSLYFVSQMVKIGGVRYAWEFVPPSISLLLGVALLVFWIYRIRSAGMGR